MLVEFKGNVRLLDICLGMLEVNEVRLKVVTVYQII